ncbi:MAG TPA: hypothetical protein VMB22_01945 [Verrucomicrobiae bacterium]|nr:hypothetical protein [Verrucomicrobiae bacterium]
MKNKHIQLDQSKLLGFKMAKADQKAADSVRGKLVSKLGAKLGAKVGGKPV